VLPEVSVEAVVASTLEHLGRGGPSPPPPSEVDVRAKAPPVAILPEPVVCKCECPTEAGGTPWLGYLFGFVNLGVPLVTYLGRRNGARGEEREVDHGRRVRRHRGGYLA